MAWKKVLSDKNHGSTGDPHAQYALDSDLSSYLPLAGGTLTGVGDVDFNGTELIKASVEVVATLPTTVLNDGRKVYLTTDRRVYTYRGAL